MMIHRCNGGRAIPTLQASTAWCITDTMPPQVRCCLPDNERPAFAGLGDLVRLTLNLCFSGASSRRVMAGLGPATHDLEAATLLGGSSGSRCTANCFLTFCWIVPLRASRTLCGRWQVVGGRAKPGHDCRGKPGHDCRGMTVPAPTMSVYGPRPALTPRRQALIPS
jgi:hypothetical protein